MNLKVNPGRPLQGSASAPGDKSLSHRAALLAALANGQSQIKNFLVAGVTQAMLNALAELGVTYQLEGATLTVNGVGLRGMKDPHNPINCSNSATTLRLLAGALALAGVTAELDGSSGLQRRPMDRIVTPLQKMGVEITSTGGCAPLHLKRSNLPLRALDITLPVASAQIKTCLLLAALAGDGPTTLREPAFSRDHTERMLRSQGITIGSEKAMHGERVEYITRLTPPVSLSFTPLKSTLPGDFSSAAFLIVAALITPNSTLLLPNVGLNPTRTGLLDALLEMGADIHIGHPTTRNGEPVGDLTVKSSALHAAHISGEDVVRMIDEFLVFAVAAACAEGLTTVQDAAELRLKESDRITGLCRELNRLGVRASEQPDGFTIQGGTLPGGATVNPHGDHRLAMALTVAGLAAQKPVTVQGCEIINESYPAFISDLQQTGADLRLEE